tara:strand:- start:221 stop:520 length:300 start_codon:yes stop_codon:yes gene_type:complete
MSKKEMKITDEQLEKVRAQQGVKGRIINDVGVLEAQKHDLLNALTNVMQKSVETAEELEKEYGKININLEDGSYEVVEVEEAEDEAETKEEEEEVVEEK